MYVWRLEDHFKCIHTIWLPNSSCIRIRMDHLQRLEQLKEYQESIDFKVVIKKMEVEKI